LNDGQKALFFKFHLKRDTFALVLPPSLEMKFNEKLLASYTKESS